MAARRNTRKPQLHLIAAAWTLTNYPAPERQWSWETKVKKARQAGFKGMSGGAVPELAAALRQHQMALVGGVDVGEVGEAEPKLRSFKAAGAVHVNVQLCDHNTPIPKAVTVARKVMQVGKALRMKPAIEWHRDTVTETPEKAMALAAQYEKRYGESLRMNFDHSHPAIIKQLRPANFWERISEYRLDLLQRSELIHFRTFTGSHCQTPITDGRGHLDRDFVAWRDHFLRPMLSAWLKEARAGQHLYAVVELGPQGSGYALACFPDVWKDAIVARGEIEKVWKSLVRRWKR